MPLARLMVPRSMRPRKGISTLLRTLSHMQLAGSCRQRCRRHIMPAMLRHMLIACLSISILHFGPYLLGAQDEAGAIIWCQDCKTVTVLCMAPIALKVTHHGVHLWPCQQPLIKLHRTKFCPFHCFSA